MTFIECSIFKDLHPRPYLSELVVWITFEDDYWQKECELAKHKNVPINQVSFYQLCTSIEIPDEQPTTKNYNKRKRACANCIRRI